MMFWDSSALIPLFIEGPRTAMMRDLVQKDDGIVAWWGSPLECFSAFARLRREGFLRTGEEDTLRRLLTLVSDVWTEIEPGKDVRDTAERLLLLHPLRVADSLQLAAALTWSGLKTKDHRFVCLDQRLREAARNERFAVLPPALS